MDNFIKLLQIIENDKLIKTSKDGYLKRHYQHILDADFIACDILINRNGGCNWDNINILRMKGYDVFPVEKDSFGWVIGGIQLSNGILTFG